jgi:hypothetical protein
MAVVERFELSDGVSEGDMVYDFVQQSDAKDDVQRPPHENIALQFVQLQEDDVHQRSLEVN